MSSAIKICALIVAAFCLLLTDVLSEIVKPPDNTVAVNGTDVNLECAVSGGAEFILWKRDDENAINIIGTGCLGFPNQGNVFIRCSGNTSVLTIRNVTSPNVYVCVDGANTNTSINNFASALVVLTSLPTCGLPNTTVITQGQQVTLPCQIGFTPASFDGVDTSISMSWSLNGTLVSGSQSSGVSSTDISVNAIQPYFPSYTCTSTIRFTLTGPSPPINFNPISTTLTCTTSPILIQYCPTFVNITPSLPPSGQVQAGSNFTCTSDGYLTPTYSWTESVSGFTINNGTAVTLPAAGGPFTLSCTATGNVSGFSLCSKTSSITGYGVACSSNTTIIDLLSNTTVADGSEVSQGKTFICSAVSSPPSSYYWSLDGGPSVRSNQYTIAVLGNHTLTCVSVIENTTLCASNQSRTININVIACPSNVSIIDVTGNSTVTDGGSIEVPPQRTFSCSASSSRPSSYSWLLNGVQVANGSQYTITALGRNSLTCSASLTNTTACTTNSTSSITVNVIVCSSSVTIVDVASNSTVANGTVEQVLLAKTYSCSAISSPPSSYSWLLNGVNVANGSQYTITALGRNTLTCIASLANTTTCSSQTSSVSVNVVAECPYWTTVNNMGIFGGVGARINGVTNAIDCINYCIISVRNCVAAQVLPIPFICVIHTDPSDTALMTATPSVTLYLINCTVCPANITIVDIANNSVVADGSQVQAQLGKTYSCSANNSISALYVWLLNGVIVANGSQYTITALGRYNLTCRASLANTASCSNATRTIIVEGIVTTTVAPSTTSLPTTSASQTTGLSTNNASQTTVVQTTTASQTTGLSTTSASQTTVSSTISATQTTPLPPTSDSQTPQSPTTVTSATSSSQTTASPTSSLSLATSVQLTSGSPTLTTSSRSDTTEGTTIASMMTTESVTAGSGTDSNSTTGPQTGLSWIVILVASLVPATFGLTALASFILFCLRVQRRRDE